MARPEAERSRPISITVSPITTRSGVIRVVVLGKTTMQTFFDSLGGLALAKEKQMVFKLEKSASSAFPQLVDPRDPRPVEPERSA